MRREGEGGKRSPAANIKECDAPEGKEEASRRAWEAGIDRKEGEGTDSSSRVCKRVRSFLIAVNYDKLACEPSKMVSTTPFT